MKDKAYLKSQLSDEELEGFKQALNKDEVIAETLLKLIGYRKRTTGQRKDIIRDPAYPFLRAYLDGRSEELEWLTEILTKGEANE